MSFLKEFVSHVLDFFFPSHCFSCGQAVEGGKTICKKCFDSLERLPDKLCLSCGKRKDLCECANKVFYFSKICSPFYNATVAQKGIYGLKFGRRTVNADFFAKEMANCVRKRFANIKFDAVCIVPAHPLKVFSRGFDQSDLLAEIISEKLGIPYIKKALGRKFISKTQHKENDVKARYKNARKSYYSRKKLLGDNVLLVDDIKTSGASLDACSRCLLYAGANEVCCVTALIAK